MKSLNRIIFCFIIIAAFIISGCNKDKDNEEDVVKSIPTVSTLDVINIGAQDATGRGDVTNDGNDPIIARGICWSTTQNPDLNDSFTIDPNPGEGQFGNQMTGLAPGGITYYVKAYATNSTGTAYGGEKSFQTTL
ncbi:hypothetical protein ACFLRZ_00845 [Bacteroidota bacterium]